MHMHCAVALLIGLAACGSPSRRPHVKAMAAGSGTVIDIPTANGVIGVRQWRPSTTARAAVLAIADRHNRSDAAITSLAERIAADGALVVVVAGSGDPLLPVRGTSRPSRAAEVAAWLRRELGAAPLFVVGHGEGGVDALRLAEEDAGAIAGVVAVEPVLTAPDVLLWIGTSTIVERLGAADAHPLPALWEHTGALDMPLLVVEDQQDGHAVAVAHDLLARSATRDGTVHAIAAPATAAPAIANWIGARVSASPPPGEVAPAAASSPGLAVSAMGAFSWAHSDADTESSGAFRALLSHGRVGWAGVLSAQSAEAHLMPLGIGVRLGNAGQLALVGGIGRADRTWQAPIEASAELPLGRHLRGLATARVGWELDDERAGDLAAGVDDVHLRLGLRIPGDRHLWQRVVAGSGLYLAGTYRRLGDADIVGVELGLHVWGSR
jgi:pimeloyl-ACP methyl ester carboxylesterase